MVVSERCSESGLYGYLICMIANRDMCCDVMCVSHQVTNVIVTWLLIFPTVYIFHFQTSSFTCFFLLMS